MKLDILERVIDPEAVENGVWSPIMMPSSIDEPLFADADKTKPCRALVRSQRSNSFQTLNTMYKAKINGIIARAKAQVKAQLAAKYEAEQRAEWFSWLLVSVENVSSTQMGVVSPERAELVAFAKEPSNQWFVDQVIGIGFNDGSFGLAEENPSVAGVKKAGTTSKS